MDAATKPCRLCRRETRAGNYCARCFAQLYPEASERTFETRIGRSMREMNEAYDRARQADEADAPVKHRGPA